MENASKALIIAGAILLSILIIGLGMYIYQQASGAVSGANLDPTKVQAYNSEFLQYEGTQSGANTRALVSAIINHNRVNTDDVSQQIDCTLETRQERTSVEEAGDIAAVVEPLTSFRAGNTYFVQFQYNRSGYITHCYISQVNN